MRNKRDKFNFGRDFDTVGSAIFVVVVFILAIRELVLELINY